MDRKRMQPFYLIFLTGYLAYATIYIARLNFSVAATIYEAEGILQKAQIGLIGSVFSLTYAISKIPNGILGDRFQPRKVIVAGLLITGFSNLGVSFFPEATAILILWGLNAIGQSMLWGPVLRVCVEKAPENRKSFFGQMMLSSVGVGSVLGLLIVSHCSTRFGLETCFRIPALFSFTAAGLVWLFLPGDCPCRHDNNIDLMMEMKRLFADREFCRMLLPAVSHGVIKENVNVWLALYCMNVYGVHLEELTGYIFFIPAFSLLGRFLYPLARKVVKRDDYVSVLSFGLCTVGASLLCVHMSHVFIAMGILGAISAFIAMVNTHLLSVVPEHFLSIGNLSFAASFMDFLTYAGAGIGSALFGIMIPHYGYQSMFLFWGVISVCSMLCLLWRKGEKKE